MFKMKKDLVKVIELFPTKSLFCAKANIDEGTLSKVLSDERPLPQNMMVNIQAFLGWAFDDLFEVSE